MIYKYLFLFSIIFQISFASENNPVIAEMRGAIETLGVDHNFAVVHLGLSDEELRLLEQIRVDGTLDYNRFGNLELLQEELPQFLSSIGNQDEAVIHAVTAIICKAAAHVKKRLIKSLPG